eukprot:6208475-Pleurochrysis_carterae.AAC.3
MSKVDKLLHKTNRLKAGSDNTHPIQKHASTLRTRHRHALSSNPLPLSTSAPCFPQHSSA